MASTACMSLVTFWQKASNASTCRSTGQKGEQLSAQFLSAHRCTAMGWDTRNVCHSATCITQHTDTEPASAEFGAQSRCHAPVCPPFHLEWFLNVGSNVFNTQHQEGNGNRQQWCTPTCQWPHQQRETHEDVAQQEARGVPTCVRVQDRGKTSGQGP